MRAHLQRHAHIGRPILGRLSGRRHLQQHPMPRCTGKGGRASSGHTLRAEGETVQVGLPALQPTLLAAGQTDGELARAQGNPSPSELHELLQRLAAKRGTRATTPSPTRRSRCHQEAGHVLPGHPLSHLQRTRSRLRTLQDRERHSSTAPRQSLRAVARGSAHPRRHRRTLQAFATRLPLLPRPCR